MQYQPINYQIRAVAEAFGLNPEPAYDNALVIAGQELPAGAKALFAVPAWSILASTYIEALTSVLERVAQHIPLDNKMKGLLSNQCLRQSTRSSKVWQKLSEDQGSDIIILPAQLGSLHHGRCLHGAREAFRDDEFELGALAVACILMMHPTWKVRERRSYIDSGDEYLVDGDEERARLLTFSRSDNGFEFFHRPNDLASPFAGTATGFLL